MISSEMTVQSAKTVLGLCNESYSDDDSNKIDTDTAARNYKYYWMFIVGAFAQVGACVLPVL